MAMVQFFKLWQQIPHWPISVPWSRQAPTSHSGIYVCIQPAGMSTVQADPGLNQAGPGLSPSGPLPPPLPALEAGLGPSNHSMSSLTLQLRERHHHLPSFPDQAPGHPSSFTAFPHPPHQAHHQLRSIPPRVCLPLSRPPLPGWS